MDRHLNPFRDILEPRRQESSTFMWVSRELDTEVPFKQTVKPTPKVHKLEVLHSYKIQEIIEKICREKNVPKGSIVEQVKAILNEIGYNMQLTTIRWLGLALTKICLRVTSGIFVNETSILKLRSQMGNIPIIYVPSHRSYADFILMSYVLFFYEIEIPAIAAGMDFHAMWGMGAMLRDTGAFFMRRSYNDDSLYWETFKQYVLQLVTRGENGIEFFIEGTRSRSNKSLVPKYGLLAMILKAYFNAEVPDILFCPVNITYDRILEEKLFAFELLGVPKPKESTSGFFKSLSIIKENYGNYYVDFGEPLSAREFFERRIDRSVHNMKPNHSQTATETEKTVTSAFAHKIVHSQQKLCVITTFNLVAIIASYYLLLGRELTLEALMKDVARLKNVMEVFGALVESKLGVEGDVLDSLRVHGNIVFVNDQNVVQMRHNAVVLDKINHSKRKGHDLSEKTMSLAVPYVMLELYVNPVFHYVVNAAILTHILASHQSVEVQKEFLAKEFHFVRSLLSKDFVWVNGGEQSEFSESIAYMERINMISSTKDTIAIGNNNKLVELFMFLLQPYICTYSNVFAILKEFGENACEEKVIFAKTQANVEKALFDSDNFIHPYALSLDTISNCLSSLLSFEAITKHKRGDGYVYKVNRKKLENISVQLDKYSKNIKEEPLLLKNKL